MKFIGRFPSSLAFLTCRKCYRKGLADERGNGKVNRPADQPCAGEATLRFAQGATPRFFLARFAGTNTNGKRPAGAMRPPRRLACLREKFNPRIGRKDGWCLIRSQPKSISLNSTQQISPGEHRCPSPASRSACASSGLVASTHHSSVRVVA
jgi:hypothetical protein